PVRVSRRSGRLHARSDLAHRETADRKHSHLGVGAVFPDVEDVFRIGDIAFLIDCRGRGLRLILVDANILIYARVSSLPQHQAARDWLDRQLNGVPRVGLPWASLLAFLRIVTNSRMFEHPEPIAEAWNQVVDWLRCDTVWVPQPTERHAA